MPLGPTVTLATLPWRAGTCRDFPRLICRHGAGPLRSHALVGRDFFRRCCFQSLGDHADARGAASRRPMDRFPELRWQSCRGCGSGNHRIGPGPDRPLLLGFRHTHGPRTDRNNVLGFPGRTGRASDLAQEAPSCHSFPIARIFSSYLEYAPFLAEVTCRSEI